MYLFFKLSPVLVVGVRSRLAQRGSAAQVVLYSGTHTTTGRKSGKEHTVPLLYLPDGENLVVVGSNGGTATHPAWWLNLTANPEVGVEIGDRKLRVRAEKAGPEEKARLWKELVAMYRSYEDYRRRTDRDIPVMLLKPTHEVSEEQL